MTSKKNTKEQRKLRRKTRKRRVEGLRAKSVDKKRWRKKSRKWVFNTKLTF